MLRGTLMQYVFRNQDFINIRRKFSTSSKLIILTDNDKTDVILNMFCDQILQSSLPIMFHINNPFYHSISPSQNSYVNVLSDYLGIPNLSWDPDITLASQVEDGRRLLLSPSLYLQVKAMFSILDHYNWTDISLVTTKYTGFEDFLAAVHQLVRNSKKAPNGKPRYKIIEELELHNMTKPGLRYSLASLQQTDARIILFHGKSVETSEVLEIAGEVGLTEREYLWILTLDSIPKNKLMIAPKGYPLGLLGLYYENGYDKPAMDDVIKMTVDIWATALNNMAIDMIAGKVKPAPINQGCNSTGSMFWKGGESIFRYLKNVTTTSPWAVEFDEKGVLQQSAFKIINLQKQKDYANHKWIEVGSWNRTSGLKMRKITWMGGSLSAPLGKPARRFVRVATLKEEPYVMYEEMPAEGCSSHAVLCRIYPRGEGKRRLQETTVDACCTGLSIDLLVRLSQDLNFDFDLFEVKDGEWGAENNGEWNGLVRVLMDNKADMVVTSFKISPDRNTQVDFSLPYLETGITIIVSIREGAISPKAFLEPYDYPSWGLILVFSVHATGISIFVFEWLSPNGLDRGRVSEREHKFSLFRSFWLIWAMLLSAAVSTDTPRSVSSRFLANMWALFALVFLASYTANLAAFMITKEEFYDLSGIRDWRLQNPQSMKPPFKFGTIPSGSTESNIKKNDPEMWRYMRKYNQTSVPNAIMAVKSQKIHAFIYDATVLEYEAGRDEGCRLRTVGNWYAMTGYGIGFPRGSKWLTKVNEIILQLNDEGETERLKKFWLKGACRTKQKHGVTKRSFGKAVSSHTLGILNFTSAFILLACGIALGALLHFLEHLYYRCGRQRLKELDKKGCCSLVSYGMGNSLSRTNTVSDVIHFHRKHRCKNRFCEVQFWKAQHQLDVALLKIERLQKTLKRLNVEKDREAVWKYDPHVRRHPNGCISEKRDVDDTDQNEHLSIQDSELIGDQPLLKCNIERESSF
ncbi:glutamate receptor ionotropic, NMDA 2B [Patella vulgata]|uniref:glutamate receptor ionotropic, NMDA 2B n=1 Tax=Patella vulgata TaxID=6465 RepID=UPI00217FBEDD|nr:glutamate receptor ionotropic, NMDA 2B [Patella vulgata]